MKYTVILSFATSLLSGSEQFSYPLWASNSSLLNSNNLRKVRDLDKEYVTL